MINLPTTFELSFDFQASHFLKVVLVGIYGTWVQWTKNSTTTKSSWNEKFRMVGTWVAQNFRTLPIGWPKSPNGMKNLTWWAIWVAQKFWTLPIKWPKSPHGMKNSTWWALEWPKSFEPCSLRGPKVLRLNKFIILEACFIIFFSFNIIKNIFVY